MNTPYHNKKIEESTTMTTRLKTMSLVIIISALAACDSREQTPEDITRALMAAGKAMVIDFRANRQVTQQLSDYVKIDPSYDQATIPRYFYLLNEHYNEVRDFEEVTIQIGQTERDDERAMVTAYVGKNSCRFAYNFYKNQWQLADIHCPPYQFD